MAALMTYLHRHPTKTGSYRFRRRIPEALRAVIKARYGKAHEWVETVGTKNPQTAKRRIHEIGIKVDRIFYEAQCELENQTRRPQVAKEVAPINLDPAACLQAIERWQDAEIGRAVKRLFNEGSGPDPRLEYAAWAQQEREI